MSTARSRLGTPAAALVLLVGALVGAVAGPAGQGTVLGRAAALPRPNVVLIMVDDMRQDDLRFMPKTERLIGDRGVRFANSFSPHPLCCPARASVLTGWYTHNHGVYDVVPPWGFPSFQDRSTIATWLQRDGYATSYLGKYLNGYGSMPAPGRTHGTSVHYVPPGSTHWRGSIDGGLPRWHWADGGTYRYDDTTLSVDGERFAELPGPLPVERVRPDLGRRHPPPRTAGPAVLPLRLVLRAPPRRSGRARRPGERPGERRNGLPVPHPGPAPRGQGTLHAAVRRAPGADWRPALATGKPAYLQDRTRLELPPEQRAVREVARQRAEALAVVDRQVGRTIRALADTGRSTGPW